MLKGKLLAVLAVSVAMLAPASAQQRAAAVTPLTPEDYAQIYQLYARYPYAFDGGLERGMKWAELFTPDGAHIAGSEFVKGTLALAEFARGGLRYERGDNVTFITIQPDGSGKNPQRIGHAITNIMVEATPEGANVKAYLMRAQMNANGPALVPGGIYFDTLKKTPDGWRFHLKHFIGIGNPIPVSIPDSFKQPAAPRPTTTTSAR